MYHLPIFVINLPDSTDRRALMECELNRQGATAEFFPAIRGSDIRHEIHIKDPHNNLTDGELGCYMSHVALWKRIAYSALPFAVVLEDDVCLSPAFLQVCKELTSSHLVFDLVRLGSLRKAKGIPVGRLPTGHELLLATAAPDGTQGYLITRSGAEALLRRISRPTAPIDRQLNQYWEYGLKVLLLREPVVHHNLNLESTIVPSGRAPINTSLPLIQRLRRSMKKRAAIAALRNQITGQPSSPPSS